MKKLFEKSGRFLRWFVFHRQEIFQRARQVVYIAKFIARHTKTNSDDIVLAKLDKILNEIIHDSLGSMDKREAIELAKKITSVKRGPLKSIKVSLDSDSGKPKLGFSVNI